MIRLFDSSTNTPKIKQAPRTSSIHGRIKASRVSNEESPKEEENW